MDPESHVSIVKRAYVSQILDPESHVSIIKRAYVSKPDGSRISRQHHQSCIRKPFIVWSSIEHREVDVIVTFFKERPMALNNAAETQD